MWTLFKVFIEFVTVLIFYDFWLQGVWDLGAWTGDEPVPPAQESEGLHARPPGNPVTLLAFQIFVDSTGIWNVGFLVFSLRVWSRVDMDLRVIWCTPCGWVAGRMCSCLEPQAPSLSYTLWRVWPCPFALPAGVFSESAGARHAACNPVSVWWGVTGAAVARAARVSAQRQFHSLARVHACGWFCFVGSVALFSLAEWHHIRDLPCVSRREAWGLCWDSQHSPFDSFMKQVLCLRC